MTTCARSGLSGIPLRLFKMKYAVGPERPISKIQRGIYVGDNPYLQKHTAYISHVPAGESTQGIPRPQGWVVQCDDKLSGLGFGWWWFPKEDWELLSQELQSEI